MPTLLWKFSLTRVILPYLPPLLRRLDSYLHVVECYADSVVEVFIDQGDFAVSLTEVSEKSKACIHLSRYFNRLTCCAKTKELNFIPETKFAKRMHIKQEYTDRQRVFYNLPSRANRPTGDSIALMMK